MIDIKTIHASALAVEEEVTIALPREECDAIRQALGIIGKYRKLALQCVGHKDKYADWTMVNYAVKNDKMIVNIKYGSNSGFGPNANYPSRVQIKRIKSSRS